MKNGLLFDIKAEKPKKEKNLTAWGLWVVVNREMGRSDPVVLGPDTSASKRFHAAVKGDLGLLRKIYREYLEDLKPFYVETGHCLRHLPINKMLNPQVVVKSVCNDPSSPDFDIDAVKIV